MGGGLWYFRDLFFLELFFSGWFWMMIIFPAPAARGDFVYLGIFYFCEPARAFFFIYIWLFWWDFWLFLGGLLISDLIGWFLDSFCMGLIAAAFEIIDLGWFNLAYLDWWFDWIIWFDYWDLFYWDWWFDSGLMMDLDLDWWEIAATARDDDLILDFFFWWFDLGDFFDGNFGICIDMDNMIFWFDDFLISLGFFIDWYRWILLMGIMMDIGLFYYFWGIYFWLIFWIGIFMDLDGFF